MSELVAQVVGRAGLPRHAIGVQVGPESTTQGIRMEQTPYEPHGRDQNEKQRAQNEPRIEPSECVGEGHPISVNRSQASWRDER